MTVQVFVPQIGSGAAIARPNEVAALTGSPEGLVLGPTSVVPFDALRLLTAFHWGGKARILMILQGSDHPLIVEMQRIRFGDFPGVVVPQPLPDPEMIPKRFLQFMCQKSPNLVIDRGTYDYLKGKPLQVIDNGFEAYAGACALRVGLKTSTPAKPATSRAMVCPKCGRNQPRAVECVQCGVIVEKYVQRRHQRATAKAKPRDASIPGT